MTALWTAAEAAAAMAAPPPAAPDITGISIDTRTLRPGDLFFALIGENSDGHAHVQAALDKGAAAAVVHQPVPGADPARLIMTTDTLAALAALAAAARARFAGTLIAITGSVGKTTAKEMLRTICAAFGKTHAAEASYNNQWGLPLTLARLPADAAFCVAEIGTNHPGEIEPLARLARPHATLITAIGTAHIGNFGSQAAIAVEKAAIQAGLVPGGLSVLPGDTPHFPALRAAAPARVLVTGTDAAIRTLASDPAGSDITAEVLGQTLTFRLPVPGAHMAANALACLLLAGGLGLDLPRAAAALASFAPLAGRGVQRRIRLDEGDILLLDESYNASTSAVRAALSVLATLPATRRIAVLGDMLEMGELAEAEHLALLPALAAADLLFACGPQMKTLFDALPERQRAAHEATSAALAPRLTASLRPGDAVLVKGSLGMKMKTIVQAIDAMGIAA